MLLFHQILISYSLFASYQVTPRTAPHKPSFALHRSHINLTTVYCVCPDILIGSPYYIVLTWWCSIFYSRISGILLHCMTIEVFFKCIKSWRGNSLDNQVVSWLLKSTALSCRHYVSKTSIYWHVIFPLSLTCYQCNMTDLPSHIGWPSKPEWSKCWCGISLIAPSFVMSQWTSPGGA